MYVYTFKGTWKCKYTVFTLQHQELFAMFTTNYVFSINTEKSITTGFFLTISFSKHYGWIKTGLSIILNILASCLLKR